MDRRHGTHGIRARLERGIALLVAIVVGVTLAWWMVGRLTLDQRRLVIRDWEGAPTPDAVSDSARPIRVLAFNMAHGRGDVGPGMLRNWRGGDREVKVARLARIAELTREVDPDVVVLNEVDFDSHWSGGLNQAEVLARALDFPVWVEQRNYDLRLPFASLSFGNAVLSRFPIRDASWVAIPPHRYIESWLIGAKGASLVRLDTPLGPVSLVPIHLEVRSEATRLGAVPVLDSVSEVEPAPTLLAGDFNSSPIGWPEAPDSTALNALVAEGWSSPRIGDWAAPEDWTYPTRDPVRAIDWVLAEPPLRVTRSVVLADHPRLSDHRPVVATIVLDSTRTAGSAEGRSGSTGEPPR